MARIVSKYTHRDKAIMIAAIRYAVKTTNQLMIHLGFTPEIRARFGENCAKHARN